MHFSDTEQVPAKKYIGVTLVVLFHIFIVYALATGLARKVVEVIKQPIETKLVDEFKPPPPPPEKPVAPPPPKLLAPPPPFIPPPEIQVQQQPQQNTISAVSSVKPDNPVMPTAQKAEAAAPAPAAVAAVHIAAVVDSRACEKPKYPRVSLLAEETGTVFLQFLVGVDGQVIESKVEKSSGSKNLDNAARSALSLCKFKPGSFEGKPEQSTAKLQYVWKLD
ncbi:energy transducer TonB [Glaciimonas sp. GG7]